MQSKSIPVTTGSVLLANMEAVGFQVTHTFFPPRLKLESHYHARACVSVILDGSFDEVLGGRTYELPHATVLSKPAGERHNDTFLRTGARVLVIEPATPDGEHLEPYGPILDRIVHFRDEGVAGIAQRIVRELASPDDVTQLAVDGLVLELWALALRRNRDHAPPCEEKRSPRWLADARDYLHAGFTGQIRVEDIAATVGVHPVHLARVFQAHFGLSPAAYVRRLRLDWAAAQLSTSSRSLSEVGADAGFADQSHFSRAFKLHTGLTPKQYRRATRS